MGVRLRASGIAAAEPPGVNGEAIYGEAGCRAWAFKQSRIAKLKRVYGVPQAEYPKAHLCCVVNKSLIKQSFSKFKQSLGIKIFTVLFNPTLAHRFS